jgi:hypothetical protein
MIRNSEKENKRKHLASCCCWLNQGECSHHAPNIRVAKSRRDLEGRTSTTDFNQLRATSSSELLQSTCSKKTKKRSLSLYCISTVLIRAADSNKEESRKSRGTKKIQKLLCNWRRTDSTI